MKKPTSVGFFVAYMIELGYNGLSTEENDMSDELPMLHHYDANYNVVYHPIIDAINKGGQLQSLKMGEEWMDDHEICLNVNAVVNGVEYGFAVWWITREFYKEFVRAECGMQDALDAVVSYIKEECAVDDSE